MEDNKSNNPESSPETPPIEIDALVKKIMGSQNPPADNAVSSQAFQKNSGKAPLDNLKSILSSIDTNAPQKDIVRTIKVRSVQPEAIKEAGSVTAAPKAPSSDGYIPRQRIEMVLNAALEKPSNTFAKQEVVEMLQELLKETQCTAPSSGCCATVAREADLAAVKQLEELINSRRIADPGATKTP